MDLVDDSIIFIKCLDLKIVFPMTPFLSIIPAGHTVLSNNF